VRYVLTGPTEWDESEALEAIESLPAVSPVQANQTGAEARTPFNPSINKDFY
jgi:hypothetical protein